MIQPKQTRFIRRVLYTLKKGYGFPVTFYKITADTLDLETGSRSTTTEYKKVDRVIILPANLQRKFEYDLTYIASNRNFTYGGLYDTSERKMIVERADLGDFEIKIDDYYIWDGKRWQVTHKIPFVYQMADMVIGKMVEGVKRYAITDVNVESTIQLTQTIAVA